MSDYYDYDGNPISRGEWQKLLGEDKIIARDRVGYYMVSTVWLGLDHSFGATPPLIFETMIFAETVEGVDWIETYCERYSTHDEALKGHERAIAEILCITRA